MTKTRRTPWNVLVQDEIPESSKARVEDVNQERSKQEMDLNPINSRNQNTQAGRNFLEDVFYIHPNDHASLQLVAAPLTGNNYFVWSRLVKRALGARNKLDLINGKLIEPEAESVNHKSWLKVDYMVSMWIMNSLSKEIAVAFQYIDNARQLWKEIENRFSYSSGPKLYQLERELSQCVQGNLSVMTYFNNLNNIWDEINILNPNSVCKCGVCTCGAEEANKSIVERRKVVQFLLGLNDGFETVRSQLLLIEPLPNVSKAYSMILQDEDQKKVNSQAVNVNDMAMYANSGVSNTGQRFNRSAETAFRPRLSKEERRMLKCTHCGESGHETRECFKLHGYPEWYVELQKQRSKERIMCINDAKERMTNQNMEEVIRAEVEKCLLKLNLGQNLDEKIEKANMVKIDSTPFSALDGYYALGVSTEITDKTLDSGYRSKCACLFQHKSYAFIE